MKKKYKTLAITALVMATMVTAMPVYASENKSERFGSTFDGTAQGYWSDKVNLTWSFWDGETVEIGNGLKYSDTHPNVTDPECLLKEYVKYPGEGNTNLNSWGQPKSDYGEDTLQLLQEFVHSFDWINSDEHTRSRKVFERIANYQNGNQYDYSYEARGSWVVLRFKEGICADFAGEFEDLAKYIGLECVTYTPGVNHLAILVKINNQWIALDPTNATGFYDNTETIPVDYETEYNRADGEFENSDSGKRMTRWVELNEQLNNGEITEEEFNKAMDELWS